MEEKLDIIAIGECLIELSSNAKMSDAECLYKYYGGDTLAAAIAALRMGSKVGFISRVGNDAFKGIATDAKIKVPAKKLDTYQKLLAKKGLGDKAVVK